MPTRGACPQRTVGPLAGTYPTCPPASRWASGGNPSSVRVPRGGSSQEEKRKILRLRLMTFWGQSRRSILSARSSQFSHLCLSALPRATKELVPTTAQTALRRTGRPGASSRSIWATCPGAWATRKGACPCRCARARATPAAAAPARQRASKQRAGWLSRVWAVPRGSVRRWTQPTPTHTHTRTLLPACMYNKYALDARLGRR